jgi:hypothetical protein
MQHVDEGILHAYLDGALDAFAAAGTPPHGVTRASVESHVRGCADCAALLEAERQLRDGARAVLLDAAVVVDAPPFEMVARGRMPQPHRRSRMRRALPLVWAASVLLAVGTGWWGSELLRAAARDQPAARASAEEHAVDAPLASAEPAVAEQGPAGAHGTPDAPAGRTAFAGLAAAGPTPLATPPAAVAAAPTSAAAAPAASAPTAPASAAAPTSAASAPTSAAAAASAAAPAGVMAPAPSDSEVTMAKPLQLNELLVTGLSSARQPRLAPTSDVSGGGVTVIRGGAALGQPLPQDNRAPVHADVQELQSERLSVQAPAAAPAQPMPLASQQLSATEARTFAARSAAARPRAEVVSPLQTFRTAVARARDGTLDWQSWDRAAVLRAGWLLVVLEEAGPPVIAVAALPGDQPMVQVRQRTAGVEIELLVWQEPGARMRAADARVATVVMRTGTLPNGDSELLLRVPSLEAFVMLRGALDSRSLLQLADGLAVIR